jgi:hypothetical protein
LVGQAFLPVHEFFNRTDREREIFHMSFLICHLITA